MTCTSARCAATAAISPRHEPRSSISWQCAAAIGWKMSCGAVIPSVASMRPRALLATQGIARLNHATATRSTQSRARYSDRIMQRLRTQRPAGECTACPKAARDRAKGDTNSVRRSFAGCHFRFPTSQVKIHRSQWAERNHARRMPYASQLSLPRDLSDACHRNTARRRGPVELQQQRSISGGHRSARVAGPRSVLQKVRQRIGAHHRQFGQRVRRGVAGGPRHRHPDDRRPARSAHHAARSRRSPGDHRPQ